MRPLWLSPSPLFRSTFSIIHERINLTLVCRVLIIRFVIGSLELSRNYSGSYSFNPFIPYCIANFFNADFDTFNWKEVPLLLYNFLIRFLNDSRASLTNHLCFWWYVIQQPITKIVDLLYAFNRETWCWL